MKITLSICSPYAEFTRIPFSHNRSLSDAICQTYLSAVHRERSRIPVSKVDISQRSIRPLSRAGDSQFDLKTSYEHVALASGNAPLMQSLKQEQNIFVTIGRGLISDQMREDFFAGE